MANSEQLPTLKQTAARWWHILRYHRKSQLARRLLNVARRRRRRLGLSRRYLRPPPTLPTRRSNDAFGRLVHRRVGATGGDSPRHAEDVLHGRFSFIGQERELPDPIDWRLDSWPEASHLWRFHLHYQDYLRDLAAAGLGREEPIWFERAWQLVDAWIEGNPLDDARTLADAWHPYCISRRLPAWVWLWSASPPPAPMVDRVVGSVYSQAMLLSARLERDVGGNHLLENARALVVVGAFFEGPPADLWLRLGGDVLRKELPRQILPHGEHFERSPMYHAAMLEAVLEVRDIVADALPELSATCSRAGAKMAAFFREILHPDGEIPLLGDSCLGETPPAGRLIEWAGEGTEVAAPTAVSEAAAGRSPSAQVVGDHWVFRDAEDFLLFDAGPVGPDDLPAHAHADLLTLEASIDGRRLMVDGGTFNYRADAMRAYCRGSAAHNVLTVDDLNQCDVWSRFRMGRRGWPSPLASGQTNGFDWARASHNAYRRLGAPTVGRWIACRPGGPWFCVDWVEGSGTHRLTSRLHLHPDCNARQVSDNLVQICGEGPPLHLRFLTSGLLRITAGWYCPQFGRRLECPVVQWTLAARLPTVCGWQLSWDPAAASALLTAYEAEETVLQWTDGAKSLEWRPVGSWQ